MRINSWEKRAERREQSVAGDLLQVLKVLGDFVQCQAILGGVLKELILRNWGVNGQFWVVFAQICENNLGLWAGERGFFGGLGKAFHHEESHLSSFPSRPSPFSSKMERVAACTL